MRFSDLHGRLLARLQAKIHDGEVTERGLARLSGISQPHIHNVAKGVRLFSPKFSDILLDALGLSIEDLLTPQDFAAAKYQTAIYTPVPLLDSPAGPGLPVEFNRATSQLLAPISLARDLADPFALRLGADPALAPPFIEGALLLVDRATGAFDAASLYLISGENGSVVRRVQPAAGGRYRILESGALILGGQLLARVAGLLGWAIR